MNITLTEFDACASRTHKGAKGDKGDKGGADFGGVVPTMTEHAPNLAWMCPLCTCSPGKLCDAIHARAAKLITNYRAACTLCPVDSETAESILASTKPDALFLDVAYPFRSVDTCGGTPVHTCVLCDNVTGIEPNCGIDNLGEMRDLRVAAERDVACRSSQQAQCACIHAEELTPISWAECAAIVHRNRDSAAKVRAYIAYEDVRAYEKYKDAYERARTVRYHGYVHSADGQDLKPVGSYGMYHYCFDQTGNSCRPARLSLDELPAAKAAFADTSVAAAIARFYGADADAAGHAAIKAVCTARGAGTTCGGLASIPTKTSREFAMLVPFAPITSEGTWIAPVVLSSV